MPSRLTLPMLLEEQRQVKEEQHQLQIRLKLLNRLIATYHGQSVVEEADAQLVHIRSTSGAFVCGIGDCPKTFRTPQGRNTHVTRLHPNSRSQRA